MKTWKILFLDGKKNSRKKTDYHHHHHNNNKSKNVFRRIAIIFFLIQLEKNCCCWWSWSIFFHTRKREREKKIAKKTCNQSNCYKFFSFPVCLKRRLFDIYVIGEKQQSHTPCLVDTRDIFIFFPPFFVCVPIFCAFQFIATRIFLFFFFNSIESRLQGYPGSRNTEYRIPKKTG